MWHKSCTAIRKKIATERGIVPVVAVVEHPREIGMMIEIETEIVVGMTTGTAAAAGAVMIVTAGAMRMIVMRSTIASETDDPLATETTTGPHPCRATSALPDVTPGMSVKTPHPNPAPIAPAPLHPHPHQKKKRRRMTTPLASDVVDAAGAGRTGSAVAMAMRQGMAESLAGSPLPISEKRLFDGLETRDHLENRGRDRYEDKDRDPYDERDQKLQREGLLML
jgi:hypothetical protein